MKVRLSIFFVLFFTNCTVSNIRNTPNFSEEMKSLKRISIMTEKNLAMENEDQELIYELAKNYISHHKEFIVYPSSHQSNVCKNNPKIQGLFSVYFREIQKENKIKMFAIGKLKLCKSEEVIWSAEAEKTVKIDSMENVSLVKTYVEKFGKKVQTKVTPYFLLMKALLDELENPSTLTEDEQNEKIEVES